MSLMNRYLNLQPNDILLKRLLDENTQLTRLTNIIKYNECFISYLNNQSNVQEYISEQIKNYIDKNYSSINVIDADINYYIERINFFVEKKFKLVIEEINIKHFISLCDYFSKKSEINSQNSITTNHYVYWRNEYYKILYQNILCGRYKIHGKNEKKSLIELLDEDWNKVNFKNLIGLSNSLNKIKFLGQNVNEYIGLYSSQFDKPVNITKLSEYVYEKFQQNFQSQTTNSRNNLTNSNNLNKLDKLNEVGELDELNELNELDELDVEKSIENKYDFRFIIDILKSNGYLLFEELNKNINRKYKKPQSIQTIKIDKRTIDYYIYIVSQKDSNLTNRKVNEILLKMKNYLEDIEESYYNNIAYRKIIVKQESEKYNSVDLSKYNRENSSFNIFKYSNLTQSNLCQFKLNPQIEPYFDIYKSYYKSRYPDREIEFDPIKSTLIVKMVFNSKSYYVHLALIQYIVMDKLFNVDNNNGLGIKEISLQSDIPISNLQETINSLLHIKLIKRSINYTSLTDMKLFINYDFTHENNKISISSLLTPKEKEAETEAKVDEDKKEFLNDRNTIVLSNIYDYVKKNKTFTKDTLYEDLSKNKIPFKIELSQIIAGIKIMLDKEDIIELTQNQTLQNQTPIYKYSE